MMFRLRRLLLIALTSSGILTVTTLTAYAGRELNHCQAPLEH